MQKIRVAAVSPPFVGGDDKQGNLESAWRGIQAAKAQGAELPVFSELYLIHCLDERSYRAAEPDPEPDDVNIVVADLDPERFISRRTDADYPLKKRRPELFDDLVRRY